MTNSIARKLLIKHTLPSWELCPMFLGRFVHAATEATPQ